MGIDKRVQILLSTYNGERYLREQLDSIVAQTVFGQLSVLIRDDGSKDSTRDILREYQKLYGFALIYGENVGITQSMWVLLQHSDPAYDYFSLSDQDDVWLPNKLEQACMALSQAESELPVLFASRSRIVDERLQQLGHSTAVHRGVSFYNAMVQNVTPGHTQVFNRTMRASLLEKGQHDIHVIDWWLYLVASGVGRVLFFDEETVLHRQHQKNSVGFETNMFKKTMRRLREVHNKKGNAISFQLEAFYRLYADQLSCEYRAETEAFLSQMNSIKDRFKYIIRCHAYRQERLEDWVFKSLYLFGKYNLNKGEK